MEQEERVAGALNTKKIPCSIAVTFMDLVFVYLI